MKKEFQRCIQCNSKDNIECSQSGAVQTSYICQNYFGNCVTGINAQGYTQRRCSGPNDKAQFPNEQMLPCNASNCNNDIYPPNRLQCYRCDGDKEDCNFMPANSTGLAKMSRHLTPCGVLSRFDQCYAYLSGSKNFLFDNILLKI